MKWILGDEVFYQMLRDYTANPAFAYKYAKTEDFKNQILLSTGKDFTEFFNDWIYGEGYPSYSIKWNQTSGNSNVEFLVSQTQSNSSLNFFKMPLPIRVNGTNGETAELVLENSTNNQAFSKAVNFQVASVEFNKEFQIIEKNSTVILDPTLSTVSNSKETFVLYPNPVKDVLKVKGISQISGFEIYSVTGQIIKKGKYTPGVSLDISTFQPGSYIIKINGKSVKFTKE